MEIFFDYESDFETKILTKYNDVFSGLVILDFLENRKLVKISGNLENIHKFFDELLNLEFDNISLYQLFCQLRYNYMIDEDEVLQKKLKKLLQLPKYLPVMKNMNSFDTYFLHNWHYHNLSYGLSDDPSSIENDLVKIFGMYFCCDYEKSKFVFVDYWNSFENYKIFAKACLEK